MEITNMFGDCEADAVTGAISVLFNRRVGYGGSRTVYDLEFCDKVIKLEHGTQLCQNVIEFEMWEQWRETVEGKRWFAECFAIAHNGRALVQEKLEIITSKDDPRLPQKIPHLFTDTKVTNWGADKKGQVKCVDYGMSLLMQGNPWRLVKAKWWELD